MHTKQVFLEVVFYALKPNERVGDAMAYRKTLDGKWICTWNCGFKHEGIAEVVKHENKCH